MTSTDIEAAAGFTVVTPEDLEREYPAVPLYEGITAYPRGVDRPRHRR